MARRECGRLVLGPARRGCRLVRLSRLGGGRGLWNIEYCVSDCGCRIWGGEEVNGISYAHHGFAHVFAWNHALFLGGEIFVRIGEELEDFLDFGFFFGGDVVLFG